MGRGRAKAKQAKVARQLKYSTGRTDLEALRRELLGNKARQDSDVTDEYDGYDYGDYDEDDAEYGDPLLDDDFSGGADQRRR
ncbi:MAG: DUF3073 domain-containing protein [Acidothermus cellulolyticus]|nr:DUF3073 domain-containing protein [Acidothermus cellulolyticus]